MTLFETREADWLSYEVAVARVLGHVPAGGVEVVPFDRAVGRALAEDLKAPRTLPEHDNSAMDGYAVRAEDLHGATEDTPIVLIVVGESLPGSPWPRPVSAGEAVRIMTGAAVPTGADSVVRVEHTVAPDPDRVQIRSGADARHNVRPAGEDMQAGDVVVTRGTTLTPGHIAVLTSTGHLDVPVGRAPRVALVSTGDELVSIEQLRAAGDDSHARSRLWADRIVDSNTPTLRACVEEAGAKASVVGTARDTRESLHALFDRIGGEGDVDALVTTGGASMGTHDLLKRVMDERGFAQDFWRVRIRPGSPVSLGFLPRKGAPPLPVFGLPGNPASAFVTFELFVRPFLRAMAGHRSVQRPRIRATASEELRGRADLTVFLRVKLSGSGLDCRATLTGPQGSGLVSSLGLADGLAQLDVGVGIVEAGQPVPVMLLTAP